MKFLQVAFLTIIVLGSLTFTEAIPRQSIVVKQNKVADWSELFPEIPNCERVIQPLTHKGEIFEQIAIYEQENYKNYKGDNYLSCGSITLRFEPSAKKSAQATAANSDLGYFPFRQPLQIKNFYAYQVSPMCGNDDSIGVSTVFFDKDKILIVQANTWAKTIMDFAQTADYEVLKKSINKTVKARL